LIVKFHRAKRHEEKYVTLWGTGKATREFLFVGDAAEGVIAATEKYSKTDPVNIGCGKDISIKELAKLVADLFSYTGEIRWDTTKPDGQPRRCLNVDRAKVQFGFEARTSLEDGLKSTIEWYRNEQERLR
jgi:nucleoside-diphosphate-sugar epimerase